MTDRAPGPRRRDRRGRGMRGPGVLPRTPGRPETRTRRERFDDLVLAVVTEVDAQWADRLGTVEYAVEDTPDLPDDWDPTEIPLGSAVRGTGGEPSRVVVFRRPIERRAESRSELDVLVLTVVVEQVADLLNVEPQVIDPRYESD
ncbi:metallopeptidase family protein [Nocardioides sp. Arc9.136]|uniref:metallopeptidase family protein n=1 Tax=Nocardioides sp. Arc9.136 TaxID=2996826 RepID=UPI00266645D8|nr:metallopeptidase family protein [Nocardioides sp. Arc9.136]WKN47566.1 metallopeptidase family protein [Nocardioides sp. Arc9.136]